MGEQTTEVLVLSPNSPVSDQIKVTVNDREKFHHGGQKDKWKLDVTVDKDNDMKMKLVERNFGDETVKILQNWEVSYENGLSVISFMKKTDKGTVVMPDLTADGSVFYGKALYQHILGEYGERRTFQEFDKKFLNLTANEGGINEIREIAQKEADKATRSGIRLPTDDPLELILHPDETWSLMCLDLEQLQLPEGQPETDKEVEIRRQVNNDAVDNFMQSLTNIRNVFQRYW